MRSAALNVLPSMRAWADQHLPQPTPRVATPKAKREPLIFTPATEFDKELIAAIGKVTYPPATFHKRFARDIQGAEQLTEAQRQQCWRMVVRFRRQIPSVKLVEKCRGMLAKDIISLASPK